MWLRLRYLSSGALQSDFFFIHCFSPSLPVSLSFLFFLRDVEFFPFFCSFSFPATVNPVSFAYFLSLDFPFDQAFFSNPPF